MPMTFEQTRLTTLEYIKALVDAGISTDEATWDDPTLEKAIEALDVAQQAKIERLTRHSKLVERREELRKKLETPEH